MIVYREKGLRFAIVCLDEEPREEKVDRLLYLFRPTLVADAYCTPFTTLDVDLHKSEEELWAQLDKTTAYEIRRARDKDKVNCLWLDAHPDANTPESSPSGNIHGMPLAILLGTGPEVLMKVGPPGGSLAASDVSILGARDIDPGEAEFLGQRQVQMFTIFDVLEQGLPNVLSAAIDRVTAHTNGVHVSIDLDVLLEDVAPGVGLPSQCGFDTREATYLCRRIAKQCRITSIDIVGLNPVRDRNLKTARLAVELLMSLLGKSYNFNYYDYLKEQR